MTGKRTKRLLSLLLSVLLVAGMLPMGAMAKDLTPTDTNDYLDVKLMAGDIPGYATQSTCTDLIWWLGTQDGYTESTTSADDLAANIEKANSIFKKASPVMEGGNKIADIEVGADGYFYVALKLDGSNLSDGKGVGAVPGGAGFKFHVAYNQNAFELADMTLTGADPASQIATNPILSRSSGIAGNFNRIPAGTAKDSIANNYTLSVDDMNKPFSCNGYTPANGYGAALAISYLPASGNAYHVSSAAEWDCVFRFHVKDTATPGTYNFSYTETNDNSSITLLKTADGAASATASDIIDFTNKTNAAGIAAHVKHSDLKVKVTGPSIKASGAVGGKNTVKIAADSCTFGDGANTAGNWTLNEGSTAGGTNLVKTAVKNADGTVTLTLTDGTTFDASKTYYVGAAKDCFTPTTTAAVSTTFQPAEAPAGTYQVKGDGATVTIANVKATDKYLFAASTPATDAAGWKAFGAVTKDFAKSAVTGKLYIQADGNTDANLIQEIEIPRIAADAPSAPTFNYTAETMTFAADNIKYTLNGGAAADATNGTAIALTSAIDATATDKSVVYWTKGENGSGANTGKLASPDGKFPNILKRPTLTVTDASDANAKLDGKTKLTVTGSGAKYWVNTTAADTTIPGSFGGAATTGALVSAVSGQTIHVVIPAAASAFRSAIVHVTGSGNDFGTITSTTYASGKVTLTMVGDTFEGSAAATEGNYTISGESGADALTVTAAAVSSDKKSVVLTLSGDPTPDKIYTVALANAGTTGSKAGVVFASGKNTFRVNSAPKYTLSAAGYTFDDATYEGGAAKTITVTGGLTGANVLDTITSTPALTFTVTGDKTFTVQGAAPANDTAVTLTITTKKKEAKINSSNIDLTTQAQKVYDGTTDISADLAALKTTGIPTKDTLDGATDVKITFTDASYESAGVSNDVTITFTGCALTGANAGDYTLESTTLTCKGKITEATITGITVDGVDDTKGTGKDAIVAAIKASGVTVATAGGNISVNADGSDLTFADVFGTNLDTKLGQLVDAALIVEGAVASEEIEVDLSGETTDADVTVSTAKQGDVLKFKLPDGATLTSVTANDGSYTVNADNTVTIAVGAADSVNGIAVVFETADDPAQTITSTVKVASLGAPVVDYDKADTKTLSITIADTDYTDANFTDTFSANYAELTPTVAIGPFSVAVKKVATPPAPGGFGVTFNTRDYGEADSTYAQADAEGKITALPKMNKVVKGAQFNGWSKDGTEAGKVDVGTLVVEDNIELIAWFEGYMNGYGYAATRPVKPTASVTRGELLKMLLVASGLYDGEADYSGTTKFTDGNGQWYTPYLICAEKSGKTIIEGYSDGTFKANRPVTRNEAAKMIAGAFGVEVDPNGTAPELKDFNDIEDWAKEFVAALYNNGTVDGRNDGAYHGEDKIQRCEAAKMINIYLGLDDASKDAITQSSQIKNPFSDISKSHWAYAEVMFASLSVPASYYSYDLTMPSGR